MQLRPSNLPRNLKTFISGVSNSEHHLMNDNSGVPTNEVAGYEGSHNDEEYKNIYKEG
jgi:hypothetical protein